MQGRSPITSITSGQAWGLLEVQLGWVVSPRGRLESLCEQNTDLKLWHLKISFRIRGTAFLGKGCTFMDTMEENTMQGRQVEMESLCHKGI